jgi:hypothetical protein
MNHDVLDLSSPRALAWRWRFGDWRGNART